MMFIKEESEDMSYPESCSSNVMKNEDTEEQRDLMDVKVENQELNEVEEKHHPDQTLRDFITGEESFIGSTLAGITPGVSTEICGIKHCKMMFIKEESEDMSYPESCSSNVMKNEDTEEQRDLMDVKVENQELNEVEEKHHPDQTLRDFITGITPGVSTEICGIKHCKMMFIKEESEDMSYPESCSSNVMKNEDTEEQRDLMDVKVENQELNEVEEKHHPDQTLRDFITVLIPKAKTTVESCPLCLRMYSQLSQHLRVMHNVKNKKERKLLLALESGRINVREGRCPIPGCGKDTTRLDRHLRTHSELSKVAQNDAMMLCKRKKILSELASLRASDPEVPMVSTLDLEEDRPVLEDPEVPLDSEEEECSNTTCKLQTQKLTSQVADLNLQVDTLTEALQNVTRRYRLLKRRSSAQASTRIGRVTQRLLSSLRPDESERDCSVGAETSMSPSVQPSFSKEPPIGEQPSTSQQAPTSEQPSTQPGLEQKKDPHYPEHMAALNELLEEYRRQQEGPDPSYKLKENVSGKIYMIKKFIAFMAQGKEKLDNLVFLNKMASIRAWISSLRQAKIKETTIQHYVLNVAQFMNYVRDTPPLSCRLSKQVLVRIQRELRGLLKSIKRGVALHQMSMKQVKVSRVLSKVTLSKCRSLAKQAIPKILALLESDPTPKLQWKFYGHFVAFLASIYGHRGGVYQNMTIKEVKGARKSTSEKAYLINIISHKTNQGLFGPVQIALSEEEYEWTRHFLRIKDMLPGGTDATFFFFTSRPNPCKNLNNYLQEAWKSMGLPGCPTFTDLQNSIASHAKYTHTADNRMKIAKFICHDFGTVDKFYPIHLNAKQAMENRRFFEAALEGPECSPVKEQHQQKRKRQGQMADRPCKRFQPEGSPAASPDRSITSGSTTPEEIVVKYQESEVSSIESSEDADEGSEPSGVGQASEPSREGEVSETNGKGVGGQRERCGVGGQRER
ncbi:uncharacterized protein LOC127440720 isoform X3 [Myxocyprinus asiaticus]|uniref:uncharacterized protein LOC127440720 isoform X3 n=2 Tax=Myxocyprinus asiaticus TaxID=70543 RepID=UPI00222302C0|nr:uncharacterized protein LOC127440720 isoform X3 [Myxocyprinus asiaticus]